MPWNLHLSLYNFTSADVLFTLSDALRSCIYSQFCQFGFSRKAIIWERICQLHRQSYRILLHGSKGPLYARS